MSWLRQDKNKTLNNYFQAEIKCLLKSFIYVKKIKWISKSFKFYILVYSVYIILPIFWVKIFCIFEIKTNLIKKSSNEKHKNILNF